MIVHFLSVTSCGHQKICNITCSLLLVTMSEGLQDHALASGLSSTIKRMSHLRTGVTCGRTRLTMSASAKAASWPVNNVCCRFGLNLPCKLRQNRQVDHARYKANSLPGGDSWIACPCTKAAAPSSSHPVAYKLYADACSGCSPQTPMS